MKRSPLIVLAFFIMIILSACASNPHIGKPVSYRWNNVCRCKSFPSTCHLELEHFEFDFNVEQRSEKEYGISGKALNTKTPGGSRIHGGNFTFFLISKGVITEAISVVPVGHLASAISFKKNFTPQEKFDGILVSYNITVTR